MYACKFVYTVYIIFVVDILYPCLYLGCGGSTWSPYF